MEEEELRRCPICDKTLNFCHGHGEKNFCMDLLVKLKSGKLTNKEFLEKLSEKVDVDKLIDYIVKSEEVVKNEA